jgi:hypothetical protein
MELLLNLAWLLMLVPAWYLWRESRSGDSGRKSTSLQALLALGCALVILFPVISATDDLHAMRAEIEESPSTKRSVRQAANEHAAAWSIRLQAPPALVQSFRMSTPEAEHADIAIRVSSILPTDLTADHFGRGPPFPWALLA